VDFVDLMQAYVLWISMFRHVDFVQAEWTTTLRRLYEIHMPKTSKLWISIFRQVDFVQLVDFVDFDF